MCRLIPILRRFNFCSLRLMPVMTFCGWWHSSLRWNNSCLFVVWGCQEVLLFDNLHGCYAAVRGVWSRKEHYCLLQFAQKFCVSLRTADLSSESDLFYSAWYMSSTSHFFCYGYISHCIMDALKIGSPLKLFKINLILTRSFDTLRQLVATILASMSSCFVKNGSIVSNCAFLCALKI